jgi:hypothetical protein
VLRVVVFFQIPYARRNWRIRRNTKKIWTKNVVEEGENEGAEEGRIRGTVRN